MKVNYYEILGVERAASEEAIRQRFRQLARENHPDRYAGDDKASAERSFQTLTEAVNVLTNSSKRRQHDSELAANVPKAATDFTQIAKAFLSRGVKSFNEGDFEAARSNFDMAVKHNPEDVRAQHYLALACARNPSMIRQAVQAIETAIQLEPYNPAYLKLAGLLCKKAGLLAKAERHYEEALRWDQDSSDINAALKELRQGKGEAKEGGKGLLDSLFKKG